MIKTDPEIITYLESNALWLVVHPVYTFDNEIHEIYPWLRAETINFSRKIDHYLTDVKYKAISAPSEPIRFFSNYINLVTFQDLNNFMKINKLDKIVYCGFHYGFCIINDSEVGMKIASQSYQCYAKHDLCNIAWEAEWEERDKRTKLYGTII